MEVGRPEDIIFFISSSQRARSPCVFGVARDVLCQMLWDVDLKLSLVIMQMMRAKSLQALVQFTIPALLFPAAVMNVSMAAPTSAHRLRVKGHISASAQTQGIYAKVSLYWNSPSFDTLAIIMVKILG